MVRTLALRCIEHDDLSIDPSFDFNKFDLWVKNRYSESYYNTIKSYVKRYYHFVYENSDLRELDMLPVTIKPNAIKSLIALSKFLGCYDRFTQRLKDYDIKTPRPNGLSSFLRLFNASDNNALEWYNQAKDKLRPNEQLFAEFLLKSGLRTSEAIHSFNLIIKLAEQNKLSEYYHSEYSVLMHFKYPKLFIRNTKNTYVTFITPEFLQQIAKSEPVSYSAMRKRLERQHLTLKFNLFRDKFGTHLLDNGILEAEIDLAQGRISFSIFRAHYWSPKLAELANRIFKGLTTIINH